MLAAAWLFLHPDSYNLRFPRVHTEPGSISLKRAASLDELMHRFNRGDFDLVAVGRALISDPDWVAKVRDDRNDELANFSPADLATLI